VSSDKASCSVVDGTAGIVGSPVVEPPSEPLTSNGSSSGNVVEVAPGVQVSKGFSVYSLYHCISITPPQRFNCVDSAA